MLNKNVFGIILKSAIYILSFMVDYIIFLLIYVVIQEVSLSINMMFVLDPKLAIQQVYHSSFFDIEKTKIIVYLIPFFLAIIFRTGFKILEKYEINQKKFLKISYISSLIIIYLVVIIISLIKKAFVLDTFLLSLIMYSMGAIIVVLLYKIKETADILCTIPLFDEDRIEINPTFSKK